MTQKPGIRTDLVKLFRENFRAILILTGTTQSYIAEKAGVSRQCVYNILNNKDLHMTGIQFHGLMHTLKEVINESKTNVHCINSAKKCWDEVIEFYRKNGFKMTGDLGGNYNANCDQ